MTSESPVALNFTTITNLLVCADWMNVINKREFDPYHQRSIKHTLYGLYNNYNSMNSCMMIWKVLSSSNYFCCSDVVHFVQFHFLMF